MEDFASRRKLHEILDSITDAQEQALTQEEYAPIENEVDEVTRLFLNAELTRKEFDAKMDALEVREGRLTFRTVSELMRFLRAAGFTEQETEEVVSHENAHMNKAQQLGLLGAYQVVYIKVPTAEGVTYDAQPAVDLRFPAEMSDDDCRSALRKVLEAPDELSPSDRAQLGMS